MDALDYTYASIKYGIDKKLSFVKTEEYIPIERYNRLNIGEIEEYWEELEEAAVFFFHSIRGEENILLFLQKGKVSGILKFYKE